MGVRVARAEDSDHQKVDEEVQGEDEEENIGRIGYDRRE